MTAVVGTVEETLVQVGRLGREVIRPAAPEVDRDARFPRESIGALRDAGLMGLVVPETYGGAALPLRAAVDIALELGRHCASTAMIWAMHQIQVACLARHAGGSEEVARTLRAVVEEQLLLASITSEAGVGGDLRQSVAAVTGAGNECTLTKRAPTVSYGLEADAYLVTARRSPDAASGDQVLVLVRRDQAALKPLAPWDTLGMRGTCSPAFEVQATFPASQVVPVPFGEIAARTMVPWSHLLWSACWTGLAADAIERAREFARGKARSEPAFSPALEAQLAQTAAHLHQMRGSIVRGLDIYEQEALDTFTAGIELNAVKLGCSQLVVEIVARALRICGMAGYSESSPYSVARHLRDAYAAALMISNDRLYAANGKRLLARAAL